MNLLTRLFAWGRLRIDPPKQTAGHLVGPASVQRTQLGLRSIDARSGIIILRNGEARAVLAVSGIPLQHASPQDAETFLVRWAAALNALPADAIYRMRSMPGGLDPDISRRRTRSTALATTAPGTGLSRLADDQLLHLVKLNSDGTTRRNTGEVVVRGTPATVLNTAGQAQAALRKAGLKATLLTDKPLVWALASSWKPDTVREWWIFKVDFPGSTLKPMGLLYEHGKKARLAV